MSLIENPLLKNGPAIPGIVSLWVEGAVAARDVAAFGDFIDIAAYQPRCMKERLSEPTSSSARLTDFSALAMVKWRSAADQSCPWQFYSEIERMHTGPGFISIEKRF
ncbi:hypothetical protein [Rhizobium mongolense]|uniref:Uncharacterized protein n=1 Tax=Rhizobium mongolense TaxID=57676 RepID=A0A7W6RP31_9HYPH|nr:hypothetical protein [Rhizobium mongolense]MBB4275343.1 hypothetical protein [Rhizobium mongolense]